MLRIPIPNSITLKGVINASYCRCCSSYQISVLLLFSILVILLKYRLTSNAKTFAGAGSFNTGDNVQLQNYQSATNTFD